MPRARFMGAYFNRKCRIPRFFPRVAKAIFSTCTCDINNDHADQPLCPLQILNWIENLAQKVP
jgi:hypothetical protein